MNYNYLGNSDLKVSQFCLGTLMFGLKAGWRNYAIGMEDAIPIIKLAYDEGINFFDTADIYSQGSSERLLGKVIKKFFKRENLIIATKVGQQMGKKKGLSKKYLATAVNASLKRLNTDYIDLYIIHRWDYDTPIEESLYALNEIVDQGKVRYLGASSLFAWQFCKILETNKRLNYKNFISMQNHYNLLYREEEREMIPLCKEYGIDLTPYSPLARGFLAGKRNSNRFKNDDIANKYYNSTSDLKIINSTKKVAKKLGVSMAEVAIAWLQNKNEIKSIILGPSKIEHLSSLIKKDFLNLHLSELIELEKNYIPKKISGHI